MMIKEVRGEGKEFAATADDVSISLEWLQYRDRAGDLKPDASSEWVTKINQLMSLVLEFFIHLWQNLTETTRCSPLQPDSYKTPQLLESLIVLKINIFGINFRKALTMFSQ